MAWIPSTILRATSWRGQAGLMTARVLVLTALLAVVPACALNQGGQEEVAPSRLYEETCTISPDANSTRALSRLEEMSASWTPTMLLPASRSQSTNVPTVSGVNWRMSPI